MSAEKNEQLNPQEVLTRFEDYVNKNRNILTAIVGGLVLIVGGYFGFKYLYLQPKETEAQEQMFYAQKYLEKDSLNLALNGDKNYPGFKKIVEDYKWTKAANLANYYCGTILLKQGKFDESITYLKSFDGHSTPFQAVAYGAMGDAYSELNKADEAVEYYKKAAYTSENEITTPMYLERAALYLKVNKKNEEAIKLFNELKNKYPNSNEGRNADKYIYSLQASN